MKYNNAKGFGWGRGEVGEKENRTEEAVVEADEYKRSTCTEYLKVIPSACAFLCAIQCALFYTGHLHLLDFFFY